MIELPEAAVLANQVNATIRGKTIRDVIAAHSPHKFAWYFGDPQLYKSLLVGSNIDGAVSHGGHVEIAAGDARIAVSDGVNLRLFAADEKRPDKHQLLLDLDDDSVMIGSVQMYGGLQAFPEGMNDNKYYLLAKARPSPLSDRFDRAYFDSLFDATTDALSLKAFLATGQRIPGLGNGVLQDILFNARMYPKRKVASLDASDRDLLFDSVKCTLVEMVVGSGRDTETDLFGAPGGYRTKFSRNTAGQPCPICGAPIHKESYLGGSIYSCIRCQRV
jgi:formamidopyrimidine-DNA glycosylase